jgi:hypothetical protein
MAMTRETWKGLVAKLHPRRLRVSPRFHAILACLLGQRGWTTPGLVALCLTGDGLLLGMAEGDCGFNEILGEEPDLIRNIHGVCEAVGATPEERRYLLDRVEAIRS